MFSILIVVIYISFISLGLPDSLLGAAWPVMGGEMNVPVDYAGIVSMIIAGGTIVSSLMSDRLTRRFNPGLVNAVSTLLTAIAIVGFGMSTKFWHLCVLAIPYGLGAGAIDAALNNYVALHYSSRHMSWLHGCWGVGAAVSPYIMGYCLTGGAGWESGWHIVGIIQLVLTVFLFISIPLWKKRDISDEEKNARVLSLKEIFKIKGVKYVLLAFLGYCAMEATAGLWASSYLVIHRGIGKELAAMFASLYYIGITSGRFATGLIADRFGDKAMIRLGIWVAIIGICMIMVPVKTVCLAGIVVAGLGSAPIYPAIIHSTPDNFGAENSQAIIGVQMASAYMGTTFMPPLFGLIADKFGIGLYPAFMMAFVILMLVMTEKLNNRSLHYEQNR